MSEIGLIVEGAVNGFVGSSLTDLALAAAAMVGEAAAGIDVVAAVVAAADHKVGIAVIEAATIAAFPGMP